jgi:hypothetical protein
MRNVLPSGLVTSMTNAFSSCTSIRYLAVSISLDNTATCIPPTRNHAMNSNTQQYSRHLPSLSRHDQPKCEAALQLGTSGGTSIHHCTSPACPRHQAQGLLPWPPPPSPRPFGSHDQGQPPPVPPAARSCTPRCVVTMPLCCSRRSQVAHANAHALLHCLLPREAAPSRVRQQPSSLKS